MHQGTLQGMPELEIESADWKEGRKYLFHHGPSVTPTSSPSPSPSVQCPRSSASRVPRSDLQNELVKCARKTDQFLLGPAAIEPIVQCLNGFEDIDVGLERVCLLILLRAFHAKVLEPIVALGR